MAGGEQGDFDFIVVDFPDPSNFASASFIPRPSTACWKSTCRAHGLIVVQSTSPLYARQSFWWVVTTLEEVGFRTAPYHALVPSFGEWGFIIAGRQEFVPVAPQGDFLRGAVNREKTRFLTPEIVPDLFRFPADMARVPAEVNRLNNQVLVRYFEQEWRKVIR